MPVEQSDVKVYAPESSAKSFENLPKDVYQFELIDIEVKEQTKWQSTEVENVFVFTFSIVEDTELYGRRMWQYASQKLSSFKDGSNLYKTLCGLLGRQLTEEECSDPMGFCTADFMNSLIGKQVRLSIGEKKKDDGTLKNIIESYLPVKEELPAFDEEKAKAMFKATQAKTEEVAVEDPEIPAM